ncbi:heavy metal-binding protein HIP-like isoform X2 [Saccostrea cucullata]|uniref:heavy metal-binding protein HIP-like isoform X2 n=1 Tax=Saccostrea cuccullata TaxID=36930 RepID=UPI002ED03937
MQWSPSVICIVWIQIFLMFLPTTKCQMLYDSNKENWDLQNQMMKMKDEMIRLRQENQSCRGNIVAFHATLSKTLNSIPINTVIKFGNVLTNEGGGYNPTTGKFTAPEDGVYSFSWTYCTDKGSTTYIAGIVDGTTRAYISNANQASEWQNTSGHLVIKLKKGNQFWVQTITKTSKLIHESYTFLSGYKLCGC